MAKARRFLASLLAAAAVWCAAPATAAPAAGLAEALQGAYACDDGHGGAETWTFRAEGNAIAGFGEMRAPGRADAAEDLVIVDRSGDGAIRSLHLAPVRPSPDGPPSWNAFDGGTSDTGPAVRFTAVGQQTFTIDATTPGTLRFTRPGPSGEPQHLTCRPSAATACYVPDVPPATLFAHRPTTPALAAANKITGDVFVRIHLDETSQITAVSILKSPSAILNTTSLVAARTSVFRTRRTACRFVADDFVFVVHYVQTTPAQPAP